MPKRSCRNEDHRKAPYRGTCPCLWGQASTSVKNLVGMVLLQQRSSSPLSIFTLYASKINLLCKAVELPPFSRISGLSVFSFAFVPWTESPNFKHLVVESTFEIPALSTLEHDDRKQQAYSKTVLIIFPCSQEHLSSAELGAFQGLIRIHKSLARHIKVTQQAGQAACCKQLFIWNLFIWLLIWKGILSSHSQIASPHIYIFFTFFLLTRYFWQLSANTWVVHGSWHGFYLPGQRNYAVPWNK